MFDWAIDASGADSPIKEIVMNSGRTAALGERHARIDHAVSAELARPGSDSLEIARLKKERLAIKDQIAAQTMRNDQRIS